MSLVLGASFTVVDQSSHTAGCAEKGLTFRVQCFVAVILKVLAIWSWT